MTGIFALASSSATRQASIPLTSTTFIPGWRCLNAITWRMSAARSAWISKGTSPFTTGLRAFTSKRLLMPCQSDVGDKLFGASFTSLIAFSSITHTAALEPPASSAPALPTLTATKAFDFSTG